MLGLYIVNIPILAVPFFTHALWISFIIWCNGHQPPPWPVKLHAVLGHFQAGGGNTPALTALRGQKETCLSEGFNCLGCATHVGNLGNANEHS